MSQIRVNTIQNANGTTGITFAANGQVTLANTPLQLTGGQIVFPATQIASADGNTLDDYEEGTWTPSFTNLGTVTLNYARYTKIGNIVTAWASFIVTTTPTKNASTFTLPFTPNSFGGGTYSRGTVEGGILEPQQSDNKCYWATDASSSASAFYTMVVFRVA